MGANMLLTMGGIILMATFVLYANGLMGENVTVAGENEYMITAISLAQSVIDEAKTKAFDENAIAGGISLPSQLTAAGALGREASGEAVSTPDTAQNDGGKSLSRFDDIDDYNGYVRLVNTPRAEGYLLSSSVGYASETCPDSARSSATFCKKLTVTVTSPYLSHSVRLSYAFIY